jgi:NADPH2:quinone reductase
VDCIYDGTSEGFLVKVAILPLFGDSDVLEIASAPMPSVGPDDVLIKVAAAGVNRADILQRRGLYPSPPDAPSWPGLEVAGEVELVGEAVTDFRSGDRVCALVPGGGYAEYVSCHASLVLRTPAGLSDVEAAALPEAVCTVWSNFRVGGVPGVRSVLVHGGSGGIGTTAIQIAKATGLHIIVTAGGAERVARCRELGADVAIDYRSDDFAATVADEGGVDMVLDCIGGDYLKRNLSVLKTDGTLVIIGLQSGARSEINLATVLSKRLTIAGTALRSRPLDQRSAIVADVRSSIWPLVPSQIRPVIHEVFPLAEVMRAHEVMERRAAFGKVVLSVA